jgi:hypothetical protein
MVNQPLNAQLAAGNLQFAIFYEAKFNDNDGTLSDHEQNAAQGLWHFTCLIARRRQNSTLGRRLKIKITTIFQTCKTNSTSMNLF